MKKPKKIAKTIHLFLVLSLLIPNPVLGLRPNQLEQPAQRTQLETRLFTQPPGLEAFEEAVRHFGNVLVANYQGTSWDEAEAAVFEQATGQNREGLRTTLVQMLNGSSLEDRAGAAVMLARFPEAEEALLERARTDLDNITDRDALATLKFVARSLGAVISQPPTVTFFTELLDHDLYNLRRRAVDALLNYGGSRLDPPVIEKIAGLTAKFDEFVEAQAVDRRPEATSAEMVSGTIYRLRNSMTHIQQSPSILDEIQNLFAAIPIPEQRVLADHLDDIAREASGAELEARLSSDYTLRLLRTYPHLRHHQKPIGSMIRLEGNPERDDFETTFRLFAEHALPLTPPLRLYPQLHLIIYELVRSDERGAVAFAVREFLEHHRTAERHSQALLNPIGTEIEWRISETHSQFSFARSYTERIKGTLPANQLADIVEHVRALEALDIGQDVDGDVEVALRPTASWQGQAAAFDTVEQMGWMPKPYLYTLHINVGTKRSLAYVDYRDVSREILFPIFFLHIPDARWKTVFFEVPYKFKFEHTEGGYSRWHIQAFIRDSQNVDSFDQSLRLMQYLITAREYHLAREHEVLDANQLALANLYAAYQQRIAELLPDYATPFLGTDTTVVPENPHDYFLLRTNPEWATQANRQASGLGKALIGLLGQFAEDVEQVLEDLGQASVEQNPSTATAAGNERNSVSPRPTGLEEGGLEGTPPGGTWANFAEQTVSRFRGLHNDRWQLLADFWATGETDADPPVPLWFDEDFADSGTMPLVSVFQTNVLTTLFMLLPQIQQFSAGGDNTNAYESTSRAVVSAQQAQHQIKGQLQQQLAERREAVLGLNAGVLESYEQALDQLVDELIQWETHFRSEAGLEDYDVTLLENNGSALGVLSEINPFRVQAGDKITRVVEPRHAAPIQEATPEVLRMILSGEYPGHVAIVRKDGALVGYGFVRAQTNNDRQFVLPELFLDNESSQQHGALTQQLVTQLHDSTDLQTDGSLRLFGIKRLLSPLLSGLGFENTMHYKNKRGYTKAPTPPEIRSTLLLDQTVSLPDIQPGELESLSGSLVSFINSKSFPIRAGSKTFDATVGMAPYEGSAEFQILITIGEALYGWLNVKFVGPQNAPRLLIPEIQVFDTSSLGSSDSFSRTDRFELNQWIHTVVGFVLEWAKRNNVPVLAASPETQHQHYPKLNQEILYTNYLLAFDNPIVWTVAPGSYTLYRGGTETVAEGNLFAWVENASLGVSGSASALPTTDSRSQTNRPSGLEELVNFSTETLAAHTRTPNTQWRVNTTTLPPGRFKTIVDLLNEKAINDLLVIGGAFRDTALERTPKDVDVAVRITLTPEEMTTFAQDVQDKKTGAWIAHRYRLRERAREQLYRIAKQHRLSYGQLRAFGTVISGIPVDYSHSLFVVGDHVIDAGRARTYTINQIAMDRHGRVYTPTHNRSLTDLHEGQLALAPYSGGVGEEPNIRLKTILQGLRLEQALSFTIEPESLERLENKASRLHDPTNLEPQQHGKKAWHQFISIFTNWSLRGLHWGNFRYHFGQWTKVQDVLFATRVHLRNALGGVDNKPALLARIRAFGADNGRMKLGEVLVSWGISDYELTSMAAEAGLEQTPELATLKTDGSDLDVLTAIDAFRRRTDGVTTIIQPKRNMHNHDQTHEILRMILAGEWSGHVIVARQGTQIVGFGYSRARTQNPNHRVIPELIVDEKALAAHGKLSQNLFSTVFKTTQAVANRVNFYGRRNQLRPLLPGDIQTVWHMLKFREYLWENPSPTPVVVPDDKVPIINKLDSQNTTTLVSKLEAFWRQQTTDALPPLTSDEDDGNTSDEPVVFKAYPHAHPEHESFLGIQQGVNRYIFFFTSIVQVDKQPALFIGEIQRPDDMGERSVSEQHAYWAARVVGIQKLLGFAEEHNLLVFANVPSLVHEMYPRLPVLAMYENYVEPLDDPLLWTLQEAAFSFNFIWEYASAPPYILAWRGNQYTLANSDAGDSVATRRKQPQDGKIMGLEENASDDWKGRVTANQRVVAVEVGGSWLRIGLFSREGEQLVLLPQIMLSGALPHEPNANPKNQEPFLELINTNVQSLLSENGLATPDVAGIALSYAANVDEDNGVILKTHFTPIPEDFPLAQSLSDHWALPVSLSNDIVSATQAESLVGERAPSDIFYYLSVSSGFNIGVRLPDGRVVETKFWPDSAVFEQTVTKTADGDRTRQVIAGFAMAERAKKSTGETGFTALVGLAGGETDQITATHIGQAFLANDNELATRLVTDSAELLGVVFDEILQKTERATGLTLDSLDQADIPIFVGGGVAAGLGSRYLSLIQDAILSKGTFQKTISVAASRATEETRGLIGAVGRFNKIHPGQEEGAPEFDRATVQARGFERIGPNTFVADPAQLNLTVGRVFINAGLEEPKGIPQGTPVMRTPGDVPGMIVFYDEQAVGSQDVVVANMSVLTQTEVLASIPLVDPLPAVIGIPQGVTLSAQEFPLFVAISRQVGPIFKWAVNTFTADDGREYWLIQIQA